MDAIEAIRSRKSIRKYTKQPVDDQTIKTLLEAGMSAPSANNEQPWHFVVITIREILNQVPDFHPYAAMLKEAPLAIAVCGDLRLEVSKGYWVQDCSAATENILIAAQANGLGAVWLAIYPKEERVKALMALLGLPDTVIPLNLVTIGYPAEKKLASQRYNAARIHMNRW